MQGFDAQSAEIWDKLWKEKMDEFVNRTKSKRGYMLSSCLMEVCPFSDS